MVTLECSCARYIPLEGSCTRYLLKVPVHGISWRSLYKVSRLGREVGLGERNNHSSAAVGWHTARSCRRLACLRLFAASGFIFYLAFYVEGLQSYYLYQVFIRSINIGATSSNNVVRVLVLCTLLVSSLCTVRAGLFSVFCIRVGQMALLGSWKACSFRPSGLTYRKPESGVMEGEKASICLVVGLAAGGVVGVSILMVDREW